jgi:hypothetical protein
MIQKPTIGRIVWYWPGAHDSLAINHDKEQAYAAIIVFVWDDKRINLTIFDRDGNPQPRRGVDLLLEGHLVRKGIDSFAEWPADQIEREEAPRRRAGAASR